MAPLASWEEWERAAELLYLQAPAPRRVRYSLKYAHAAQALTLKVTDDVKCLQYKTDAQQDVRKIDKFISNLMRHMASNDH